MPFLMLITVIQLQSDFIPYVEFNFDMRDVNVASFLIDGGILILLMGKLASMQENL